MVPKSKFITKTIPKVSKEEKEKFLKQKGMVFWMSGLSGSGKSTIAQETEKILFNEGYFTMLLDGDNVRHGLNADLAFTDKDRLENLRRVAEVAKLLAENGIIVITSFISPFNKARNLARKIISETAKFYEIYIKCDIKECSKRDPKGLYEKARKGLVKRIAGIHDPFEEPLRPDLVIQTDQENKRESVKKLITFIQEKQNISENPQDNSA